MNQTRPARFIDSHTGGEPTRLLIEGGPDLGGGSMAERRERFMREHDAWRRALVNEPRGSDVLVGALLCAPVDSANLCGVIFFNNVGYLGMCGHGSIGLIATLAHLGRVQPGVHGVETPVGTVRATLHADTSVSIDNVASRRVRRNLPLEVPGHGLVHGDVAWGGNWFFLCHDHGLSLVPGNIGALERMSEAIRLAMQQGGLRGDDGLEIDHIELLGPAQDAANHGRSFVMCPGGAYDRSPCGTGTSAKLACLAADGALAPGQLWRQESVLGSVFEASYRLASDGSAAVLPTIRGRAHVTLDAQVLIDPHDPWAWGLPMA